MKGDVPLSPWVPLEFPALALPGCHQEQPPQELAETHKDESMGEALPGSLNRWEVIVCRNKALYQGGEFWMRCLKKDTKVVKG